MVLVAKKWSLIKTVPYRYRGNKWLTIKGIFWRMIYNHWFLKSFIIGIMILVISFEYIGSSIFFNTFLKVWLKFLMRILGTDKLICDFCKSFFNIYIWWEVLSFIKMKNLIRNELIFFTSLKRYKFFKHHYT